MFDVILVALTATALVLTYKKGRASGAAMTQAAALSYLLQCKELLDDALRANVGRDDQMEVYVQIGRYASICRSTREVARLSEAIGNLVELFGLGRQDERKG